MLYDNWQSTIFSLCTHLDYCSEFVFTVVFTIFAKFELFFTVLWPVADPKSAKRGSRCVEAGRPKGPIEARDGSGVLGIGHRAPFPSPGERCRLSHQGAGSRPGPGRYFISLHFFRMNEWMMFLLTCDKKITFSKTSVQYFIYKIVTYLPVLICL